MTDKRGIVELLDHYHARFPDETPTTKRFVDYVARTDGEQLYSRKNFDGHITTSAFIIDVAAGEMLLLRHKSLQRWLQPGGHTEGDESLLLSALREAVEETGMEATHLANMAIHENANVPFDIDSHYIPPNPRKEEDGHYHHDLRYLFVYSGNRDNSYNQGESTGMQWVGFDSLKDDQTFGMVIDKLNTILKQSAY